MRHDPGAGGSSGDRSLESLTASERSALDALDRYLAGEEERLDPQVHADGELLGAVREMLRASPEDAPAEFLNHQQRTRADALMARISMTDAGVPVSARRKEAGHAMATWSRRNGPSVWWRAAFGVVVCTLLGMVFLSGLRQTRPSKPLFGTTYTTRNGQRAEIQLPDGSRVTLNVASQLNVPADFGRGHRTLTLTGEALFTVVHQGDAPFTVMTGTTTTRVLGTSFAVRHYASDTSVMVAVREGKVAVDAVIVTAQHRIDVLQDGQRFVRPAGTVPFAFANNVLTLNSVLMRDAIVDLNRWYDADIRLADPALGLNRLHASFAADSLADLVEILAVTLDARVIRNGRVLTLYPK